MNSPHKRPITQKMFPFDDVIMNHDKYDMNSLRAHSINTTQNLEYILWLILYPLSLHDAKRCARVECLRRNQDQMLFYIRKGLVSRGLLRHVMMVPDDQVSLDCLNTLSPRQMDAISQTTFLNAISWMKTYEFRLTFH